MREQLKNIFPTITYMFFCAVILGAVLVLKPAWGFMDDFGLRELASSFWESSDKLGVLKDTFVADVNYGRFRPVYYLWVLFFYGLFNSHPLLFNLFLTTLGLLCLPMWGKNLQLAYGDEDNRLLWIYCLSFFIFTPFWNIFMYISLQERFFLVFGGLGLFSYLWAKKKSSMPLAILSGLILMLLVLGKETGLSLFIALGFFSLVDYLFFSREKRVNLTFLMTSLFLGVPYLLFLTSKILGVNKYPGTENYSKPSSLNNILLKFGEMPFVCKGILLVALISISVYFYDHFILKKRFIKSSLWLVFPLFLVAYIGLLLPWGYPTYMLSPVAIFLFSTAYLGVYLLKEDKRKLVFLPLTLLALFVVVFNNIPSIGVMADKWKVTEYVATHISQKDSHLVAPPPLLEQADSLTGFTGRQVRWYGEGVVNASQLKPEEMNYLIMSRDCGPFRMENLNVGAEIYRNNTWSIHEILFVKNSVNTIKPDFQLPFFKKLKNKIKSL